MTFETVCDGLILLALVFLLGVTLLAVRKMLPSRPVTCGAGRARIRDSRLLQRGAPVPYGIAIAAGTALTLNKSPLFAALPLP